MLEKLCGYTHHASGGGIMEIRDSGTSLTVATRSPNEPSSDYIRGMVTIVNFAFFDSLMLPMFISLPLMGPKSTSVAITLMLSLVVISSFILQFFLCRQVAFYRLLLVLSVSLSVRYCGLPLTWEGSSVG
ncbi:hypothetical protein UCDDA912_g06818 [Diaporthe ampelina]|uniref:Uncharacterized protein n=1 Tax=Diaporthe ampelina TaxID=1214573 RepID=A0A0G2FGH6_9PEZI|nr:hypothetical protein UCDDA912_g06818 [Diaporthe ampelina]